MYFDSHCHLYMEDFNDDREAVVARARAAGVVGMVFIGYSLDSSRRAVELAETLDGSYAAVGIHPHDAKNGSPAAWEELTALARSSQRVVAIGETGLDYYRDFSPRQVQGAGFRAQLGLARALDLPVVVHDRDAHEDTMRILAEDGEGLSIILHCFSGDRAMAKEAWARGYSTGVSGPVTYPTAEPLRALLREAPRDRILIETDAPYLAPQRFRGGRCEPAHVVHAAEQLAALWGTTPEEVGQLTTATARRIYRLPAT
jgi:TatD DNase family protein